MILSAIFGLIILLSYNKHDTNTMKPAIGMLLGVNAYQSINAFVSNICVSEVLAIGDVMVILWVEMKLDYFRMKRETKKERILNMNKLASLGLVAILLAAMLSVFAVPASAENETATAATKEYAVESWDDMKNLIEQSRNYDNLTITLPGDRFLAFQTIVINHPCTITIKKSLPSNFIERTDSRAFFINSEDVTLNFVDVTLDGFNQDIDGSAIYITEKGTDCIINGCNFTSAERQKGDGIIYSNAKCTIINSSFRSCISHNGDGGAVYLNAEGCTVSTCYFDSCYAQTNGGAIFANKDECKILKNTFVNCASKYDGGAIYVGVSVDDCEITECYFLACCSHTDDGGAIAFGSWCNGTINNCSFDEDCTAADEGNWVYGDGDDTVVRGCTQQLDDNCYVDCAVIDAAGSVISGGNLWIIIAVAVAALGGVAVLAVVKKKKKPAVAEGAEDTDEE